MSTRGCPSCNREAGFHQPSCCYDRQTSDLDVIRAKLTTLMGECMAFAADCKSRWAAQLVVQLNGAILTAAFVTDDIERVLKDEREKAEEKKS